MMHEHKNLMGALLKAKAAMGTLTKDAKNPHFKSTYASLAAVVDVLRQPLTDSGIVYIESPVPELEPGRIAIDLTICHAASGESITYRSPVMVAQQQTPQAIGSALTYARRYQLMTVFGLAPEDDGNEGTKTQPQRQTQQPPAQATHRQPASTPSPANGSGSDKAERLFAKLRRLQADSKKEASQPMYAFASGIINRLTDDSHTEFFEFVTGKEGIANEDGKRIGHDLAKYIIDYANESPSKEDKEKGLTANPRYSVDVVEAIKAIFADMFAYPEPGTA